MTPGPAARPWHDRAAGLLLGGWLAAGGRRANRWRLLLTVTGVGAGVLVLLFAASARHLIRAGDARADGLVADGGVPTPGVDPLYLDSLADEYRGTSIAVSYLRAGGPHAPRPPGVDRLPGPGEAVLSPALAKQLAAPDAQLLRERYPQRVVGTIGRDGLLGPADQRIYLGSTDRLNFRVYRFGLSSSDDPLPALLWALLVVGVVVLLFPVFVFVAASARLADAERDRRLGTLRLIGASAAQVRWVAAGEALLAAALGLALGSGLFVAARPLVEGRSVAGIRPFAADVVPAPPLVLLIVVAVPALVVGSALVALRQPVDQPLGVVRQAGAAPRRLWWRLLPPLAGAAVLADLIRSGPTQFSAQRPLVPLAAAVLLILLGIPTMLPWLLQRSLRRTAGGTLGLQLATSRLRLDSGTPARVVSGIGVVLAGAISLASLLAAAAGRYSPPPSPPGHLSVGLAASPATAGTVEALRRLPGVRAADDISQLLIRGPSDVSADVGSCAALRTFRGVPSCVDGQVFVVDGAPVEPGQRVLLSNDSLDASWRVPAATRWTPPAADELAASQLLITPAALPADLAVWPRHRIEVSYDPADPDVPDRVRTAVAPLGWRADVYAPGTGLAPGERDYLDIRRGLFAGALLTLLLAGATLLASAIDQTRQRRRPLAALAASGVPRSVLARSLLWQTAIPVLLGVLVADLTGVLLATLVARVVGVPPTVEWADVAAFSAAAVGVVGAVSGLVLPAVRRVTRPTELRAE